MGDPMPTSVETVLSMLGAFDRRDPEEFVRYLAEDVVVQPPPFLMGRKEQRGPKEVAAAFDQLEETIGPDRELGFRRRRYFIDEADERRVLVVVQLSISTGGGVPFESEAAMLAIMTEDLKHASAIRSWASEAEGLAQLEQPVEVTV